MEMHHFQDPTMAQVEVVVDLMVQEIPVEIQEAQRLSVAPLAVWVAKTEDQPQPKVHLTEYSKRAVEVEMVLSVEPIGLDALLVDLPLAATVVVVLQAIMVAEVLEVLLVLSQYLEVVQVAVEVTVPLQSMAKLVAAEAHLFTGSSLTMYNDQQKKPSLHLLGTSFFISVFAVVIIRITSQVTHDVNLALHGLLTHPIATFNTLNNPQQQGIESPPIGTQ